MKKIFLLFIFFVATQTFAQINGISYQAIILNPKGEQLPGVNNLNSPLVNKDICMVFKFVDEFSNVEYQETVQTKTDGFGMVNLVIGSGNKTAGYATSFKDIVWNISKKSLIVGINTDGSCTTYIEISNQDFSYVPLALSAISAENVTGVVAIENGGTNAITLAGARTNLQINNVDNTSDANKPISIATQSALNLKENLINKSTDVVADQNSDVKYPSVKAVKIYIDANTSNNVTALANEITRATTAETTIITNLTNETSNRTAANLLKEDLANKSTNVTTDGASDTKYPSVKSVKNYVDAGSSTNATALANEVSRATTAENTLTTNLATEATTARAAELANATAIATETTNRTTADGTLTTNLAAEVSNRTVADLLKEDLANKSTDVTTDGTSDTKYPSVKSVKTYVDASSSTNVTALANEVTRATTAENTLTTNLATEATTARTAELVLTNDLATEVTNRTVVDLLKEDLANKSTNVITDGGSETKYPSVKSVKTYVDASSSTNATALANEVTRATTAENTLTTNLAAETSTRTSDITTLQTNINTVQANVDTNETNRIDADDNMQNNIDSLRDNVDASVTVVTTALALKAPLDSPEFTGTVTGIDKTMVGLSNVNDTSDADKPVSTLTQTALDLKVDKVTGKGLSTEDYTTVEKTKLAAITGTNTGDQDISGIATNSTKIGDLTGLTTTAKSSLVAAVNEIGAEITTNTTKIGDLSSLTTTVKSNLVAVVNEIKSELDVKANIDSPAFTGTVSGITKAMVGLGNVENTSDLDKPISADTQTALDLKENLVNKSINITTDGSSDTKYPSVKSVKTYVDNLVSGAFVDLTTNQTISGTKTFDSNLIVNGVTVGGAYDQDEMEPSNTLLGYNVTAQYGSESTAVGYNASAKSPQSIALGSSASANQTQGISIGFHASIGSSYGFAIGSYAQSNAMQSVALGPFTQTSGQYSVALGYKANASAENAIAIGKDATNAVANTIQLGNASITNVNTSGTVTSTGFVKFGGTSSQYLMADGSISAGTASVRDVADEFLATLSQTSFTLTQTPSVNSKVKMYINGIRISNSAYSVTGTTLTYNSVNNGNSSLSVGDRIQFDYFY